MKVIQKRQKRLGDLLPLHKVLGKFNTEKTHHIQFHFFSCFPTNAYKCFLESNMIMSIYVIQLWLPLTTKCSIIALTWIITVHHSLALTREQVGVFTSLLKIILYNRILFWNGVISHYMSLLNMFRSWANSPDLSGPAPCWAKSSASSASAWPCAAPSWPKPTAARGWMIRRPNGKARRWFENDLKHHLGEHIELHLGEISMKYVNSQLIWWTYPFCIFLCYGIFTG